MPTTEFRELCRKHAKKYIDIQRDSFKRLGVTADWGNPYITMDFKFEANIYRTLCQVAKGEGLFKVRRRNTKGPYYFLGSLGGHALGNLAT